MNERCIGGARAVGGVGDSWGNHRVFVGTSQ